MRFDKPSDKLMFIRTEEGIGMQAFVDTYHNIEFHVEAINWTIGNPTIELGSLLMGTQHAPS